MGSGVTGLLQQAAAARSLEEVLEEHGQVAAVVIETLTSDPLRVTTPDGDADEEGGQRWIVAQAGMFLLYMAILIYGSWILTGVTEEKSSRVVEVLLSAVHPWQLLGGKVLGIGGLGLAQFIITIIVALAAVNYTGSRSPHSTGPPRQPRALVHPRVPGVRRPVRRRGLARVRPRTPRAWPCPCR